MSKFIAVCYFLLSTGLLVYSFVSNYTLDIHLHDSYYVIDYAHIRLCLGIGFFAYALGIWRLRSTTGINILLLGQLLSVLVIYFIVQYFFGPRFGVRYISGISEQDYALFIEKERRKMIIYGLVALSYFLVSSIIVVVRLIRQKPFSKPSDVLDELTN